MDIRKKEHTPYGRATMAVGRAVSPFLQYQLFLNSTPLLARLGLRAAPLYILAQGSGIGQLGTVPTLSIVSSGLAALKHIWWVTMRNHLSMPAAAGAFVTVLNFIFEGVNTLATAWALGRANAQPASELRWPQYLGFGLVIGGLLLEAGSEEQRWQFKKDPANKGKLHDTGAFGVVRHANYLGYTIWRVGAAMISGVPSVTLAVLALNLGMFAGSIPDLTQHMKKRYPEQWPEYERKVPYAMIPGIW